MASNQRIERKLMAHFIDTKFRSITSTATPSWYRIGKDIEEYIVELNPEVEVETDILGNEYVLHNGYAPSAEGEPFYAYENDSLFAKLQNIIDELDTECETTALEVHMWDVEPLTGFLALRQSCYIVPTSYGGDTSGYQIPFNIVLYGPKIKGRYQNGVFTPESGTTPQN